MQFLSGSEVNKKLSAALSAPNVRLVELADKCGIDAATLSRMKGGKAGADFEKVRRIAESLGAYPSDFLPTDWLRPEKRTDLDIIEKAVISVLEASERVAEKHGERMQIKQLAKLVRMVLDDRGSPLSPSDIEGAIRMACRASED